MAIQGILITDLDDFTGVPSSTDFFAIDTGSDTRRLAGDALVNASVPKVDLDTEASSGDDYTLYTAINALGWASDVIE